jgi:hypothetical protein
MAAAAPVVKAKTGAASLIPLNSTGYEGYNMKMERNYDFESIFT